MLLLCLRRRFCIPGSHPGAKEILWKPVHAASCRQTHSSCVNPRTRRAVLDKLPNQGWKQNSHVHTQRAGYISLGTTPSTCSYTASRCKLVSPHSLTLHLHGHTNLDLWTIIYFALSYPESRPSINSQTRGKSFNSLLFFLSVGSQWRERTFWVVILLMLLCYTAAYSCRFLGQMA